VSAKLTRDFPQSGEDQPVRPTLSTMIADGLLAIIAGSDTTSMALSSVVYFLCHHRDALERLQAEIKDVFEAEEDPVDPIRLAKMPWLNACMCASCLLVPRDFFFDIPRFQKRSYAPSPSEPVRFSTARSSRRRPEDYRYSVRLPYS
jgi:hypothetical protein